MIPGQRPRSTGVQINSRPSSLDAKTSSESLGDILRRVREQRGWTFEHATSATGLPAQILQALESDEWARIRGEVLGRDYLRTYASFLMLDPHEMVQKRQATAQAVMPKKARNPEQAISLETPPATKADAPTARQLRKLSSTAWQRSSTLVAAGMLLLLGLLTISAYELLPVLNGGAEEGALGSPIRTQGAEQPASAPTFAASPTSTAQRAAVPALAAVTPLRPTFTPTSVPTLAPTMTPAPPTATPIPPTATATARPTWTATFTPIPWPTWTPTAVQPPPPTCADPRAIITAPGVDQRVSGIVNIMGTATHESMQYYKLEYTDASDSTFNYLSGGYTPVVDGQLGRFDTTVHPNGRYILRIVVVDQHGNFPEPCQVNIDVQN